ncbi:hypothetical protein [Brumimicrobium mesophilum]|uniref:hypothetical protein n=1 Tax=Brumimicrobium mesophilum TaxID=392717 RepID=UPI000D1414EC|nr:hypothetical protein [Brumimicrobium mesophilum]
MKKILLYLILLLAGVGIGYLLNSTLHNSELDQKDPETVYVEKIKKKIVRDTIKIKKYIDVPSRVDSVFISDTVYLSDSLITDEENKEFLSTEEDGSEEIIIMEEMISQRTISLTSIPNDSTDVSEILNLKSSSFSKDIIVEFWQSPLNLTGYELTRNRLKLFGFNPNEVITLQIDKNEEQILLNAESMSLVLRKTKQFKTLKLR